MLIVKESAPEAANMASEAIKGGKTVVCPTDTVYGLICDATDKEAVRRLFKIKKRNESKAVPIFVKDIAMAKKVATINKEQEKILKKYWPGKLTAVLKRKSKFQNPNFKIHGVGDKTIALRIPEYKLILGLLKELKRPLTGTSANISGKPESTEIKKIIKQFENQKLKPELVIDAGNLKKSHPSTIIDLTTPEIKTLRKGAVKIKWK
jgi:L-threonylcarbamoyladenylate synthase